MALSAIEDRYLSALTEREFPTFTPDQSAMAAPEGVDEAATPPGDVLMAAGPAQTVSDSDPYANRGYGEMKAVDPTTRQRIASFLQSGFESMGIDRARARKQAESLIGGPNSNLPLSLGLADLVPFLGTGLQLEEGVEMGKEAKQAAERGSYGEAALLGAGSVLSLAPGVVPTAKAVVAGGKALAPVAADMAGEMLQRQGLVPGIVAPSQAMATNVNVKMPTDPVFAEAVGNTPGAQITDEGLLMDVVRFQKPEQEGAQTVRTGVFYLPSGASSAKHYKTGKTGYGGTEKFKGQTLIRNPLFVKGATGGKAPEQAYIELKGKDAFKELESAVMKVVLQSGYWGKTRADKVQMIDEFLDQYAPERSGYGVEIERVSREGNTLRYALQELAIGVAVREAGYDAVVGYSKGKAGASISEVFDVREQTFPASGMESEIHDAFTQ